MDTKIACVEATSQYPFLLFFFGVIATAAYIKLNEKLTLFQVLAAVVGLRSIRRNWKINLMHAATILVPGMLWVYLSGNCLELLK
ncbi:hypothetical protein [Labrenzia sp. VG12]|uniref:hypothetical protein n=1 Tax=Labrenzia sp. VG12 TaxID=2021862 RepID=UPI000B8C4A68|nr:hypothetical protein [Labrenzia sp. VG12]ASP33143.1 hypothetical protein CHH27_07700 [Labrenzia sp. VG12]